MQDAFCIVQVLDHFLESVEFPWRNNRYPHRLGRVGEGTSAEWAMVKDKATVLSATADAILTRVVKDARPGIIDCLGKPTTIAWNIRFTECRHGSEFKLW